MNRKWYDLPIAILSVLITAGCFILLVSWAVAPSEQDEANIKEYKLRYQCVHTGLAGRSGELKVYTCLTGIKLESEMRK